MKKETDEKLLKNILKFSIVPIFSAILSFITLPIISRIFSHEDYGKINMFFTMGNMIVGVFLLGLDSAYIRFFYETPKGTSRNQVFSFSLIIGIVLNIVATVVIFIVNPEYFSNLLFNDNNLKSLILLSLYAMTLIIFRLLNITYRMEQNIKQYNLQNILQMLITRVMYVCIALYSKYYYYSILSITVGMIILCIFYMYKQRHLFNKVKPIKKSAAYELLAFSIPIMPTTLVIWLNNSIGKLMLSGSGRYDEIGALAMTTTLANIFAILPTGFAIFWSSFMYENYNTKKDLIKKVHNYIVIFSIVIVLGSILMQDMIFLIIGKEYRSSQLFFTFIMLNPIQALLTETTSYGISIAKKTKYNMGISIISCLVNVGISYVLIPIYGGYGVAIGIAVSSIILLILKTIVGQKLYCSIESKKKTIIGFITIIAICMGNIYYYNMVVLRTFICIVVAIIINHVYRGEITDIVKNFAKYKLNFSNK